MAKTTAMRQRREQVLGGAGQEDDGHEHDADAERGDEGGDGDLLRAVQNRAQQRLALAQVAVDVLDLDGGVVHQDADRQRQAAQRHHVDGLVQQVAGWRARSESRAESRCRR